MRDVTLAGTTITTSALGFGTASLMGKLGKRESQRLLETAYDNGIRHFDTAPSYGYGEAEAVLGEFSARKHDVTVATKFGLSRGPARASMVNRAKNVVRPILRAVPALSGLARKAARDSLTLRSNFSPSAAALSLATSLRLLRRERLDVLLLHECRAADLLDDALLRFLSSATERGDIASFGIASDPATIAYAIECAPAYIAVVQCANNAGEPNIERLPTLERSACITHSPFGGYGRTAPDRLETALAYAAQQNPRGIILFGSQKSEHIVANVKAFT